LSYKTIKWLLIVWCFLMDVCYLMLYLINFWSVLPFVVSVVFLLSDSMLSLVECYILEVTVLLSIILFSFFLGVKGVFVLLLLSNFLTLSSLWFLFTTFNGAFSVFITNFGSNTQLSSVYKVDFGLMVDFISYNFSFLTMLIASFVSVYAFSYMRNEPRIILFIIFLKSFVLSMITLLWASNWFVFVLGWEMIGVTSFLLINFWSSKITTLKSAFKAFIFNKLSDGCLVMVVLLSYMWGLDGFFNNNLIGVLNANKCVFVLGVEILYNDILLTLLLVCSFCKSAQFGFHSWLPDSMEAPVPASALIHSATLVSAGIYVMLRYSTLLLNSNLIYVFITISAFTAFYGSIISSFQTDVKKVLAYSTISHCGFLMFSITLNNPHITVLYLYGHGLYKSLSFIGAGNLIQYANNYQDMRKMGGFGSRYAFEFFYLTVCLLNLSSFPFFLNFFSKHFLFNSLSLNGYLIIPAYLLLLLAAFSGVFYSLRILYFVFLGLKKNYYTTNTISSITMTEVLFYFNSSFKNINWLSLLSMLFLYISSALIMLKLFTFTLANSECFLDSFNSLPNISFWFSGFQYFYIKVLLLQFILILVVVFVLFKRGANNLIILVLLVILLSLFVF
jgi:NADH:ubiquinone oxidoreductase subunit 5 (subunit L)/multisubunit Na+/H+ antiporter MnhA subunit